MNAPNRLIHEKSPYLLQHAYNPVDWFPWGDEAFKKANEENKPIFLSIGYSTCHWCHVMGKESFEDRELADLLNTAFVCIKVDREERPDIDNIYMTACQLMTGTGGWPLTIIMTPSKEPFYASTYIPKRNRFGRIGLLELIPHIQQIWTQRRSDVLLTAERITSVLKTLEQESHNDTIGESTLEMTFEHITRSFDEEHGGFGEKPKFPMPHHLYFLLRYWKRTHNEKALWMVEKTLQALRSGGIFDHVGFGIHRYSTDEKWLLPHFEKMLYDQALLAIAYIEAYQATGKPFYERTAREIFTYVLRDMTAQEGGFFSAEDADTDGEEGKFYMWTYDELKDKFNNDELTYITRMFNIQHDGNFASESSHEVARKNILFTKTSPELLARELGIAEDELNERTERIRRILFDMRLRRTHPSKDDKILVSWNGLMIAALAKGAAIFNDTNYLGAAAKATNFILETMRTRHGRLMHRFRDGDISQPANADDYAYFIWGLIELYEATLDARYLNNAYDVTNDFIRYYWDSKNGGFYFTPEDGESLIVRQKILHDGALPSSNSLAMLNLLRLGNMTGNATFLSYVETMKRLFSGTVKRSPTDYAYFMSALDFALGPYHEIRIVGKRMADDTREFLETLRKRFLPNVVILFTSIDDTPAGDTHIAPHMQHHKSKHTKATAYICTNSHCSAPVTDSATLLALLGSTKKNHQREE